MSEMTGIGVSGSHTAAIVATSTRDKFIEKHLLQRPIPNGERMVELGKLALSRENMKHAIHALVDDPLREEVELPKDRFSFDATSIVWGKHAWGSKVGLSGDLLGVLVKLLRCLGIMYVDFDAESKVIYKWMVPDPVLSRDEIIAGIQQAIEPIRHPHEITNAPTHLFKQLVPGPNFASSSPPTQHEGNVARLYSTISLIVWVFLRSDLVKTHFQKSYTPDLVAPRQVISLAYSYVSGHRKPDIAVIHRPPPDGSPPSERVSEWSQIACIGEVKYAAGSDLQASALRYITEQTWFMMIHSYSRRFSLGLTQCGNLFTLGLTDRGGNCTTESADISDAQPGVTHTHRFIQALSHITLAPDEEVGDDHFFPTFGGSFQMKFPHAPNDHRYLKDLTIISRLFHSFAFTGKGTQILLAKPTEPVETTFPTHVVVKDSWPTPAETHEAYLIKHVRECLRLAKDNQLGVAVTELKHLTLQSFPDVLHEYFCESVNPNTGQLSHEATNVRRSCGLPDPTDPKIIRLREAFQRRLRYRIVFNDIVVDSTWFASRREYFTCLLHNLEAHQFAAMDAQILHGDVTPFNQWMVMNNATAEDAVPEWTGNQPPTPRQAQLGDFGLAFKLLEDRTFIQRLSEAPATTTPITNGDGGGTGGLMKPANDKIGKARDEKLKDKPSLAMDRSGSPLFMATQTLADPFSQRVLHTIKHDLEGFWWSTLFVALNCQGPYGRIVDWRDERLKKDIDPAIRLGEPGEPYGIDMPPPNWLRNGIKNISYKTIVGGRLQSLGNWLFFEQLVLDFWHDRAILDGLKEMFEIFMPVNLTTGLDLGRKRKRAEDASPEARITVNDAAINVTHEKMIDIVKRILDNMVDEPAPSRAQVEQARKRYGERLRCDLFSSPEDADSRPPSASSESRPRGGVTKPSGITKQIKPRQKIAPKIAQPANIPGGASYHLFHAAGSSDSPHYRDTDMSSLPSVAVANRVYASASAMASSSVAGHKRQRFPAQAWTTGAVAQHQLVAIDEHDDEGGDEGDDDEAANDYDEGRGKRLRGSL